jgi:trk system potassium uptake protein TrkA
MKILILGAGQVGATVAENLAGESHDVTLVDHNPDALAELEERLDLRTVEGKASHPDVLQRAGAREADLLVAVTSEDETNMVACQVAASLFHTPKKIARIRSPAFQRHPELFGPSGFPIDVLINPEVLVTEYVMRLIQFPGALQVLDFAKGKIQLVAIRTFTGGPLVGHRLAELRDHLPETDIRVAAIFREGKSIVPTGETVIEVGDEVFFISPTQDIPAAMAEFGRFGQRVKRVMLAGGGNIGLRLANALENHYSVKMIERSPERAKLLSETLKKTLVFCGSATEGEISAAEGIDQTDVFCAVTNDEEANILSAILAKRQGAKLAMALINRASYVDLVQSSSIDVAISPKLATISRLLAYVRHGDVVTVHSLRHGAAEAIEAVAHGDKRTSRVIGREIGEIKLPEGTIIGAVVRNDEIFMGHHNVVIENGDHVILFLVDKSRIPEVERLFEPVLRRNPLRRAV